MRRILASLMAVSMLVTAAVAFVGVGSLAGPAAQDENGSGTWTVMVYMCADNNLEPAGLSDLVEMETVGSEDDVNVVVLLDTEEAIEGTHWYVVDEAGYKHIDLANGKHDCDCDEVLGHDNACLPEQDMGAGATLTYFIVSAVSKFPADHYMLVLWDHGGGWRGVCYDDSHFAENGVWVSRLTTPETAAAVADAQAQIRAIVGLDEDFKVTIIGYDACLNGMVEVVYQNRDIADYMFASINLVPWDGMDYVGILSKMVEDPRPTIDEIGHAIVDSYVEYYSDFNSPTGQGLEYFGDVTLSFFQLGDAVDQLALNIDILAHELVSGGYAEDPGFRGAIASSESQTPKIPTYMGEQLPFIDLGLFAEKLGQNIPDLQTPANAVAASVNKVVLYENHVMTPGGTLLRTSGISVYFTWCNYYLNPAYQFETYAEAEASGNTVYWGMAFIVDTWWDEFVFLYSKTYDPELVTLDPSLVDTM
jgi:hypothetical protein